MSTKKIQILGSLSASQVSDADTVDGKHASDFATADHTHEQIDVLTNLVGDTDVSTQIANAISSKADSEHVHDEATASTSGFLSATDKEKLDGIESGANKIIVDDSFVDGSTNPVQSCVIWGEVEFIWEEMNNKASLVHRHPLSNISETDDRKIMTADERIKLDGIEDGANNTVVDSALSETSTNPVENRAVYEVINDLSSRIGDTDISAQIADAISGKADEDHTHELSSFGIYASATELNKLDGVTVTTAELNYLDGTAGNIQNQLDDKAEIGHTHDEYADSTHTHAATDLPTIPINKGGTGATTVSGALEALGVTTYVDDAISNIATDITVDSALSSTSTNPVQNKVVYSALSGKANSEHTHSTATTSAAGLMSANDKKKLNGISAEASAVGISLYTTGAEIFNDYDNNVANGTYAHAEGYSTSATGPNGSHSGGNQAIASGDASFAHGYKCQAAGAVSVAWGEQTIANGYQFVCGQFNDESNGVPVGSQSANYNVFIVGDGTSASNRNNAFRVTADGSCYNETKTYGQNADFAEYFEWTDGNPENEDRRGRIVTLDGEKIKLATSEDNYVLGIITGTGAFIGNVASNHWQGKYLVDEFGERIYQDVEVPERTDEVTGEIIPAYTVQQWVINPEHDPNQEYISRQFRPEWSPVGMLGQVIVVDDGTCVVNGYCAPSVDGIGTAAESGYRVMKRIDDTHIKVLVR